MNARTLRDVEVRTTYDPPPIPERAFDWRATVYHRNGDMIFGFGAKEAEAIADLESLLDAMDVDPEDLA